jgi:hypothetical protein
VDPMESYLKKDKLFTKGFIYVDYPDYTSDYHFYNGEFLEDRKVYSEEYREDYRFDDKGEVVERATLHLYNGDWMRNETRSETRTVWIKQGPWGACDFFYTFEPRHHTRRG